ncbi:MAG: hypothetical protein C4560_10555 [Nitrospiraceae bacterium]|nr:MAG: hypothetical protein C4560_10555 [Nitrospiraceae bacterium]
MTKLTIETDDNWTREKIKLAINTEAQLLRKTADKILDKIKDFENRHGRLDREDLYGKVDDMELLEWEGEIETLQKVQARLKSLEEIIFEYK